jgi:hypothetical protein
VFTLDPGSVESDPRLLITDADLVLEGLELNSAPRVGGPPLPALVAAEGPSFHAANCRFELIPGQECIVARGSVCDLRNCDLISVHGLGVNWNSLWPLSF